MSKPLKGFITYSHENTEQKDELRKRLAVMEQQNELVTWDDGQLTPGDGALQKDILKKVADSDLLLYLVSAASLASENCKKELDKALERDIKIISIILEYCDWPHHQLSNFEVLPHKGKPISKWEDSSEGWQNVVDGIRRSVHKILTQTDLSSGRSEKDLRAELAFERANVRLLRSELDEAIEAYSQSIDLRPQVASSYNNRGVVYWKKGDFDLAITDFDKVIGLKSNDAKAYTNRGIVYSSKGDHDKAIIDHTKAIELKFNYAEAYNNRGAAYSEKGDHDEAIVDLTKSIELEPDNADTYNNLGVVYDRKGDHDKAIADYNKAIELEPSNVDVYNNRGAAYSKNGEYDRAISDLTKVIEFKPDSANAYIIRGIVYSDQGKHNFAIIDYNKAIELKSDSAEAYTNRGIIYGKMDEFDRAIEDFETAIKIKSDFAEAYHNRGNAYGKKGAFDVAIADYTKAIQLKPDYVEAYNYCGNAYLCIGEFNSALANFNKAIELKPTYAEAYYNRGNTYVLKNDFDRAIVDYTKVIQLKPDYVEVHNNRGNAYISKREYDLAIVDYTKAIELKPDDPLAYSNRGTTYCIRGEYDLAIKDYTKVIELRQDYADVYYNRGGVYSIKGEYALAIKDYDMAIKLKGVPAQVYYYRGETWLHLREWEKAKADLTTAKRSGVDITASFHNSCKDVETYERRYGVKFPEDIALLLTQRRRTRYPKTQKVLDDHGNPLESPNVVNLRAQLRNAGIPLGEYVKTKPAFGINAAPIEAFVVDEATRDKLIASHPSSADILKPFLHGQDLRRWHVDTPHQWLIFTHRGIAINDYPAILEHLKKYREPLRKRKGKQEWYELPASLGNAERFAQPKLVCPDTYNHQTFAVDTAGYYYGNTSYLIPTEETWLCGLLNSRTVEWFYSQVSNQLTIDPLRARSGYIQQIPIPNLTSTQKALIAKIVDYLIYLQQQPTINSKDLAHARDHIMLGYFERIIDGLVYESYLPEDLHKGDKHFFQPLLEEQLPSYEEIQADKMAVLRDIFELLYERTHLVRRNLYYLDSVKAVRIIEGKI